jgi:hypothetical protein
MIKSTEMNEAREIYTQSERWSELRNRAHAAEHLKHDKEEVM